MVSFNGSCEGLPEGQGNGNIGTSSESFSKPTQLHEM